MDSGNTLSWTNGSSGLQNDSFDLVKNIPPKKMDNFSIAMVIMCALGLPGNLLVIAVYVRQMTTSMRVYMFALAVADSAVCVCGSVLIVGVTGLVTKVVVLYSMNISFTFSALLLVLVSIERLIAIRRPYTFSMEAQRAKTALMVVFAAAAILATVRLVAVIMKYVRVVRIIEISILFSIVLIMITCYTLMALTLLKNIKVSRNQVGVLNVIRSLNLGPSHMSSKVTATEQTGDPKSAPVSTTNKATAKQTNAFKNVFLLFVISVVFVACWLPAWLSSVGVSIPTDVKRTFIINSVVNPFIYGVASAMFRKDVRHFYSQTRVKLSACYH
ncbi:hypothetical protein LSAT2_004824 [Lamellibrachia satsuma]|nr:hypothetical protein LSAT2_004824 [Lamellibrachia satsuma]